MAAGLLAGSVNSRSRLKAMARKARTEAKPPSKASPHVSERPKVVPYHYVKCTDFRTIHVDGAIGGPTPRGLIHVAVYSERPAIPQRIDVGIGVDGRLNQEVSRSGKDGILRELQCDLVLDLNAAESLANWLNRNIAMLKQAISEQKEKGNAQR
ncbi:MAG: hypothetical protein IT462_00255 [Planctomycetes bacterium]|nr:hypothetical protein [Planctomycetota bacterium]